MRVRCLRIKVQEMCLGQQPFCMSAVAMNASSPCHALNINRRSFVRSALCSTSFYSYSKAISLPSPARAPSPDLILTQHRPPRPHLLPLPPTPPTMDTLCSQTRLSHVLTRVVTRPTRIQLGVISFACLIERTRTKLLSPHRTETPSPSDSNCTLCFDPIKSTNTASFGASGCAPQIPLPHGVCSAPPSPNMTSPTPPQAYGELSCSCLTSCRARSPEAAVRLAAPQLSSTWPRCKARVPESATACR